MERTTKRGCQAGGDYTLGGGFWRGGVMAGVEHKTYLPLVMRHK